MPGIPEEKIIPFEKLTSLANDLRKAGKRLVTTNGCFDLLHWGHIKYLSDARSLGDVLICGVNADVSVKRLKGNTRPIWPERVRALQLAGLESVDYVAIFQEDTPVRFLEAVKPSIHVKGGDYKGKEIPEQKVMTSIGGKVVCVPLVEGFSTTSLIERLKLLPNE